MSQPRLPSRGGERTPPGDARELACRRAADLLEALCRDREQLNRGGQYAQGRALFDSTAEAVRKLLDALEEPDPAA